MKTLETMKKVPDPNQTGRFILVPRKIKEVFQDLQEALNQAGLMPDQGITLSYELPKDYDFPVVYKLLCNASWGSNEGIYIDIVLVEYDEQERKDKWIRFVTGKSLGETTDDFDYMQYVCGYIYRLFMGNGEIHSRYILIKTGETQRNHAYLINRVNEELAVYIKQQLFCERKKPQEYAEDLALRSMILAALVQSDLPDEKLEELLNLEQILEHLQSICKSVLAVSMEEIIDMIASSAAFSETKCRPADIEDSEEKSNTKVEMWDELSELTKLVEACSTLDDEEHAKRITIAEEALTHSKLSDTSSLWKRLDELRLPFD